MGCPLLSGEKCNKEVQEYVVSLCKFGTVVNTVIVRSVGAVVLCRRNPGLPAATRSDGGDAVLTKDWAHYLLQQMRFVK